MTAINQSMNSPIHQYPDNRKPVSKNRCKAHRKNGEQCKKAAITGATVCRMHGGAARQVVNAARVRLQNAADKMARELLGIATDDSVPEGVRLAAVKDALDRAGLKPITAVDLEISTKPWEAVFEGVSKVIAGPRYPATQPALEGEILEDGSDTSVSESDDDAIEAEIDDDEIDHDPYLPPGFQRERESESAGVIDVEIDMGYTDQIMTDDGSAITTPDSDDSSASEPHGPDIGPLGMGGPTGSGLLSLQDANEAVAEMRAREAALLRNLRRL